MIKIDLITGFLGAGKTTFMKRYAEFLINRGMRLGILENDYGAVNVDRMLLQEMESDSCTVEMVSGGCDRDCHRRRFKTKLIAMGMSGYDRVLVEPSGIFDVDEFFDSLYEEPLCRWYEIGNVFAIVDAHLENTLSEQSEYLLASQIANAGRILLSHTQDATKEEMINTITHMNRALERFQCERRVNEDALFDRPMPTNKITRANRVVCKDWDSFTQEDFEAFLRCGYVVENYRKEYREDGGYTSLYFLKGKIAGEQLHAKIQQMMQDATCGAVFRVKGFWCEGGIWHEINATPKGISTRILPKGQEILLVIGEGLNQERIEEILGMKANEIDETR